MATKALKAVTVEQALDELDKGVPASRSGVRAAHGAAKASPPEASPPNADNLRIWEALAKTDPSQTKQFSRAGGFKGTAVKPIWVVKRLTELFGPCGEGWGIDEPSFQVIHGDNKEVLVYCTVSCWHGSPANRLYGVGGDKVVTHIRANQQYNRPERWENDDEAFKKAFTDAVNNAFKFVGVAADIHMGQFDDSKYVNELRREFEEAANPKTGEPKKRERVTLDGPYTCPTQLMTAAREFVRTLNGIGDLAEFIAWKQTKDVKDFVNQLRRDMPDWWSGGPSVPADFVPLEILVSQKKRDLEQIEEINARSHA
jgi:hypothetical protein